MKTRWLVRLFLWISVLYNIRTPYSACPVYKSYPADRIFWVSFGHSLSSSEQMLKQYPTKCHESRNCFINHTHPIFRCYIMCLTDEESFRWQRTNKESSYEFYRLSVLWKRQCQAFCLLHLYKNSLLRDCSIVQISWSQSLHLWRNISDPQLVQISLAAPGSIHFYRTMLRRQQMQEVSSCEHLAERSPFWEADNLSAHEEIFVTLYKETKCEDVDWIHAAWDAVQLQSLLNRAMSIQIP